MDVQKTMEFILEQQAAMAAYQQEHAADNQKFKAVLLAHESDIQAHTEWLSGLSAALQRLTDQMQDGFVKAAADNKKTRENLDRLAAENATANKETRENLDKMAAANAAANKETRENLDKLARTVQDMIPRLPKQ